MSIHQPTDSSTERQQEAPKTVTIRTKQTDVQRFIALMQPELTHLSILQHSCEEGAEGEMTLVLAYTDDVLRKLTSLFIRHQFGRYQVVHPVQPSAIVPPAKHDDVIAESGDIGLTASVAESADLEKWLDKK